jgi:hypothetical protein
MKNKHMIKHNFKKSNKKVSYAHNRPWRSNGCDTLKIPHYLENKLTDGGKVDQLCSIPQKHYK